MRRSGGGVAVAAVPPTSVPAAPAPAPAPASPPEALVATRPVAAFVAVDAKNHGARFGRLPVAASSASAPVAGSPWCSRGGGRRGIATQSTAILQGFAGGSGGILASRRVL
eukprot:NODE_2877_length_2128_cov_3.365317.p5 GENE.NODE_2877_length_2128_cov_3.365317~~NODE_2877_length_2128_cov_3.365317.p5  ORF type:complete len:111 (-),score=30.66 NODE_2877_length_2128_cov_3.365317:735-1067(-)